MRTYKQSLFFRVATFFTLFVFISTTLAWSAPDTVYRIKIPKELGSVKERWAGPVKTIDKRQETRDQKQKKTDQSDQSMVYGLWSNVSPLIIHIQDAHASLEAQQNVAKIIDYLAQNYNVQTVGIEGASGAIDVSKLRQFPLEDSKKFVTDLFMKEGKLSGAEAEAIVSCLPIQLLGVEDRKLFEQNFRTFYHAVRESQPILEELDEIEAEITVLKGRLYSKPLRVFDKWTSRFESGRLGISKFLPVLVRRMKGYGIDPTKYVYFSALVDVIRKEAEKQRSIEAKEECVGARFPRPMVNGQTVAIAEQTGGETPPLQASVPTLSNSQFAIRNSNFTRSLSLIDMARLVEEIHDLSRMIRLRLARSTQERDLVERGRYLALVRRLVSLKATDRDVECWRKNRQKIARQFLRVEPFLAQIDSFYAGADARSRELVGNLLAQKSVERRADSVEGKKMSLRGACLPAGRRATKQSKSQPEIVSAMPRNDNLYAPRSTLNAKPLALVAGGYHTAQITSELRRRNVPYLVITPNITDARETLPYLDKMTGKLLPLNPHLTSHISIAALGDYLGIDLRSAIADGLRTHRLLTASDQELENLLSRENPFYKEVSKRFCKDEHFGFLKKIDLEEGFSMGVNMLHLREKEVAVERYGQFLKDLFSALPSQESATERAFRKMGWVGHDVQRPIGGYGLIEARTIISLEKKGLLKPDSHVLFVGPEHFATYTSAAAVVAKQVDIVQPSECYDQLCTAILRLNCSAKTETLPQIPQMTRHVEDFEKWRKRYAENGRVIGQLVPHVGRVQDLQFSDGTFDLIFLCGVLFDPRTEERDVIADSVLRLVKDGGTLVVSRGTEFVKEAARKRGWTLTRLTTDLRDDVLYKVENQWTVSKPAPVAPPAPALSGVEGPAAGPDRAAPEKQPGTASNASVSGNASVAVVSAIAQRDPRRPKFDIAVPADKLLPVGELAEILREQSRPDGYKVQVSDYTENKIRVSLTVPGPIGLEVLADVEVEIKNTLRVSRTGTEPHLPRFIRNALWNDASSYLDSRFGYLIDRTYYGLNWMAVITEFSVNPSLRGRGLGELWYTRYLEPYLVKCGIPVVALQGTCRSRPLVETFWRQQGFSKDFYLNQPDIISGEEEPEYHSFSIKSLGEEQTGGVAGGAAPPAPALSTSTALSASEVEGPAAGPPREASQPQPGTPSEALSLPKGNTSAATSEEISLETAIENYLAGRPTRQVEWESKNILSLNEGLRQGLHRSLYHPLCGEDAVRTFLAYDVDRLIALDIRNLNLEEKLRQLGISVEVAQDDTKGYLVKTLTFRLGGRPRQIIQLVGDVYDIPVQDYFEDGTVDVLHVYHGADDVRVAPAAKGTQSWRDFLLIAYGIQVVPSAEGATAIKREQEPSESQGRRRELKRPTPEAVAKLQAFLRDFRVEKVVPPISLGEIENVEAEHAAFMARLNLEGFPKVGLTADPDAVVKRSISNRLDERNYSLVREGGFLVLEEAPLSGLDIPTEFWESALGLREVRFTRRHPYQIETGAHPDPETVARMEGTSAQMGFMYQKVRTLNGEEFAKAVAFVNSIRRVTNPLDPYHPPLSEMLRRLRELDVKSKDSLLVLSAIRKWFAPMPVEMAWPLQIERLAEELHYSGSEAGLQEAQLELLEAYLRQEGPKSQDVLGWLSLCAAIDPKEDFPQESAGNLVIHPGIGPLEFVQAFEHQVQLLRNAKGDSHLERGQADSNAAPITQDAVPAGPQAPAAGPARGEPEKQPGTAGNASGSVARSLVEQVLAEYDIGTLIDFQETGGGYSNRGFKVTTSQGNFFLKELIKRASHIEEKSQFEMQINHLINQKVKERGCAWRVPYLFATRDGQAFVRVNDRLFMLYEFVEGDFADWGESGGKRLAPTAKMMTQLHSILGGFSGNLPSFRWQPDDAYHDLPRKIEEFNALKNHLNRIDPTQRTKVAQKFLERAEAFIAALEKLESNFPPSAYAALPKQLVHLDLAPIHIQYKGNTPILIIDWENVKEDTRAVDFVKGIVPSYALANFGDFVRLAALYQIAAEESGNPLDGQTLAVLPYINATHFLKLAAGVLKEDLTQEISLDWPLSQMEVVTHLMTADCSDFVSRVKAQIEELKSAPQRTIRTKSGSSPNLLQTMTLAATGGSNVDVSPIQSTLENNIWQIRSTLRRNDNNFSEISAQEPIDVDGYSQLRMKLKIKELVKDERANQRANVRVELKLGGKHIFVTRSNDISDGELAIDIPDDLDKLDAIRLVFLETQTTIRRIDFEIQEIRFLPATPPAQATAEPERDASDSTPVKELTARKGEDIVFSVPGNENQKYRIRIHDDFVSEWLFKGREELMLCVETIPRDRRETPYIAAMASGISMDDNGIMNLKWIITLDYPGILQELRRFQREERGESKPLRGTMVDYRGRGRQFEYRPQISVLVDYLLHRNNVRSDRDVEEFFRNASQNPRRAGMGTAIAEFLTSFTPVGSKIQFAVANKLTLEALLAGEPFENTLVGKWWTDLGYDVIENLDKNNEGLPCYVLEKKRLPVLKANWENPEVLGKHVLLRKAGESSVPPASTSAAPPAPQAPAVAEQPRPSRSISDTALTLAALGDRFGIDLRRAIRENLQAYGLLIVTDQEWAELMSRENAVYREIADRLKKQANFKKLKRDFQKDSEGSFREGVRLLGLEENEVVGECYALFLQDLFLYVRRNNPLTDMQSEPVFRRIGWFRDRTRSRNRHLARMVIMLEAKGVLHPDSHVLVVGEGSTAFLTYALSVVARRVDVAQPAVETTPEREVYQAQAHQKCFEDLRQRKPDIPVGDCVVHNGRVEDPNTLDESFDDTFDLVIAPAVLDDRRVDQEAVADRLLKLTKPGGTLIVSDIPGVSETETSESHMAIVSAAARQGVTLHPQDFVRMSREQSASRWTVFKPVAIPARPIAPAETPISAVEDRRAEQPSTPPAPWSLENLEGLDSDAVILSEGRSIPCFRNCEGVRQRAFPDRVTSLIRPLYLERQLPRDLGNPKIVMTPQLNGSASIICRENTIYLSQNFASALVNLFVPRWKNKKLIWVLDTLLALAPRVGTDGSVLEGSIDEAVEKVARKLDELQRYRTRFLEWYKGLSSKDRRNLGFDHFLVFAQNTLPTETEKIREYVRKCRAGSSDSHIPGEGKREMKLEQYGQHLLDLLESFRPSRIQFVPAKVELVQAELSRMNRFLSGAVVDMQDPAVRAQIDHLKTQWSLFNKPMKEFLGCLTSLQQLAEELRQCITDWRLGQIGEEESPLGAISRRLLANLEASQELDRTQIQQTLNGLRSILKIVQDPENHFDSDEKENIAKKEKLTSLAQELSSHFCGIEACRQFSLPGLESRTRRIDYRKKLRALEKSFSELEKTAKELISSRPHSDRKSELEPWMIAMPTVVGGAVGYFWAGPLGVAEALAAVFVAAWPVHEWLGHRREAIKQLKEFLQALKQIAIQSPPKEKKPKEFLLWNRLCTQLSIRWNEIVDLCHSSGVDTDSDAFKKCIHKTIEKIDRGGPRAGHYASLVGSVVLCFATFFPSPHSADSIVLGIRIFSLVFTLTALLHAFLADRQILLRGFDLSQRADGLGIAGGSIERETARFLRRPSLQKEEQNPYDILPEEIPGQPNIASAIRGMQLDAREGQLGKSLQELPALVRFLIPLLEEKPLLPQAFYDLSLVRMVADDVLKQLRVNAEEKLPEGRYSPKFIGVLQEMSDRIIKGRGGIPEQLSLLDSLVSGRNEEVGRFLEEDPFTQRMSYEAKRLVGKVLKEVLAIELVANVKKFLELIESTLIDVEKKEEKNRAERTLRFQTALEGKPVRPIAAKWALLAISLGAAAILGVAIVLYWSEMVQWGQHLFDFVQSFLQSVRHPSKRNLAVGTMAGFMVALLGSFFTGKEGEEFGLTDAEQREIENRMYEVANSLLLGMDSQVVHVDTLIQAFLNSVGKNLEEQARVRNFKIGEELSLGQVHGCFVKIEKRAEGPIELSFLMGENPVSCLLTQRGIQPLDTPEKLEEAVKEWCRAHSGLLQEPFLQAHGEVSAQNLLEVLLDLEEKGEGRFDERPEGWIFTLEESSQVEEPPSSAKAGISETTLEGAFGQLFTPSAPPSVQREKGVTPPRGESAIPVSLPPRETIPTPMPPPPQVKTATPPAEPQKPAEPEKPKEPERQRELLRDPAKLEQIVQAWFRTHTEMNTEPFPPELKDVLKDVDPEASGELDIDPQALRDLLIELEISKKGRFTSDKETKHFFFVLHGKPGVPLESPPTTAAKPEPAQQKVPGTPTPLPTPPPSVKAPVTPVTPASLTKEIVQRIRSLLESYQQGQAKEKEGTYEKALEIYQGVAREWLAIMDDPTVPAELQPALRRGAARNVLMILNRIETWGHWTGERIQLEARRKALEGKQPKKGFLDFVKAKTVMSESNSRELEQVRRQLIRIREKVLAVTPLLNSRGYLDWVALFYGRMKQIETLAGCTKKELADQTELWGEREGDLDFLSQSAGAKGPSVSGTAAKLSVVAILAAGLLGLLPDLLHAAVNGHSFSSLPFWVKAIAANLVGLGILATIHPRQRRLKRGSDNTDFLIQEIKRKREQLPDLQRQINREDICAKVGRHLDELENHLKTRIALPTHAKSSLVEVLVPVFTQGDIDVFARTFLAVYPWIERISGLEIGAAAPGSGILLPAFWIGETRILKERILEVTVAPQNVTYLAHFPIVVFVKGGFRKYPLRNLAWFDKTADLAKNYFGWLNHYPDTLSNVNVIWVERTSRWGGGKKLNVANGVIVIHLGDWDWAAIPEVLLHESRRCDQDVGPMGEILDEQKDLEEAILTEGKILPFDLLDQVDDKVTEEELRDALKEKIYYKHRFVQGSMSIPFFERSNLYKEIDAHFIGTQFAMLFLGLLSRTDTPPLGRGNIMMRAQCFWDSYILDVRPALAILNTKKDIFLTARMREEVKRLTEQWQLLGPKIEAFVREKTEEGWAAIAFLKSPRGGRWPWVRNRLQKRFGLKGYKLEGLQVGIEQILWAPAFGVAVVAGLGFGMELAAGIVTWLFVFLHGFSELGFIRDKSSKLGFKLKYRWEPERAPPLWQILPVVAANVIGIVFSSTYSSSLVGLAAFFGASFSHLIWNLFLDWRLARHTTAKLASVPLGTTRDKVSNIPRSAEFPSRFLNSPEVVYLENIPSSASGEETKQVIVPPAPPVQVAIAIEDKLGKQFGLDDLLQRVDQRLNVEIGKEYFGQFKVMNRVELARQIQIHIESQCRAQGRPVQVSVTFYSESEFLRLVPGRSKKAEAIFILRSDMADPRKKEIFEKEMKQALFEKSVFIGFVTQPDEEEETVQIGDQKFRVPVPLDLIQQVRQFVADPKGELALQQNAVRTLPAIQSRELLERMADAIRRKYVEVFA